MLGTGNKFNKDTQLFSPDQVSRIFDELKIAPAKSAPKSTAPAKPDPNQSVEDLLKNNFIEDDFNE